ncbi:hypothetical protein GW535_07990 [Piscirickettsia salmonis]|nr:hypothetical protein GW535_07990 [Piscirickettsia salmonis]
MACYGGICVLLCMFCFDEFGDEAFGYGVVYAVWCGLGLVFICALDYYMFSARLGLSQWLAIGLIMSGIMILKWS